MGHLRVFSGTGPEFFRQDVGGVRASVEIDFTEISPRRAGGGWRRPEFSEKGQRMPCGEIGVRHPVGPDAWKAAFEFAERPPTGWMFFPECSGFADCCCFHSQRGV